MYNKITIEFIQSMIRLVHIYRYHNSVMIILWWLLIPAESFICGLVINCYNYLKL